MLVTAFMHQERLVIWFIFILRDADTKIVPVRPPVDVDTANLGALFSCLTLALVAISSEEK